MTEKQIEHLKKVLADSQLAENSPELDDLILKSAHESAHASQVKFKSTPRNFLTLVPVSFLRSATLAIVFTIGTFFAMGQLVSVDENVAAIDESKLNIKEAASNEAAIKPDQTPLTLPENIALEPAPSSLSRDQILMNFELSDTEELLAQLSFDFSENPKLVQNNIEVAMIDISSLIQTGELDNARQRYSDLKTQCDGCSLPATLEALVLAVQEFSIKVNDSETG